MSVQKSRPRDLCAFFLGRDSSTNSSDTASGSNSSTKLPTSGESASSGKKGPTKLKDIHKNLSQNKSQTNISLLGPSQSNLEISPSTLIVENLSENESEEEKAEEKGEEEGEEEKEGESEETEEDSEEENKVSV